MLEAARAKSGALAVELETLLETREACVLDLGLGASLLEQSHRIAEESLSRVSESAQQAGSISGKVRALDASQQRLRRALDRVDELINVSLGVAAAKQALSSGDLERAAGSVHRVLDPWRRRGELAPETEMLVALETEIAQQVERELERVSKLGREGTVEALNLSKLLFLVGKKGQGLKSFVDVLTRRCYDSSKDAGLLVISYPDKAIIDHLNVIPRLIDLVAETIRIHAAPIDQAFGTGSRAYLLDRLSDFSEKTWELVQVS